jgi:hypothetical protein
LLFSAARRPVGTFSEVVKSQNRVKILPNVNNAFVLYLDHIIIENGFVRDVFAFLAPRPAFDPPLGSFREPAASAVGFVSKTPRAPDSGSRRIALRAWTAERRPGTMKEFGDIPKTRNVSAGVYC